MAEFVLVHGGGHGGWCWKWAAALLRRARHDVYTPTRTGFGERVHLLDAATSFETFVEDILNPMHSSSRGGCLPSWRSESPAPASWRSSTRRSNRMSSDDSPIDSSAPRCERCPPDTTA